MMGATDVLGLTCSVILEEGFPRADLRADSGVDARGLPRSVAPIVLTGDTKVMGKGEIDGIVINTTGVGSDRPRGRATPACARAIGIIVTGTLGDHGMAVMATRHGLDARRRPAFRRRADQRADPRRARTRRRARSRR